MKTQTSYLGIDVSKSKLHLATPQKFLGEFENTVAGHQALIQRLNSLKPIGIVLEASGGYERIAAEAMQDAGLPVTIAQPGCVKHFAKSIKVLAKTDRIDAQIIARFGEATQPSPTPKTPENVRKLRALNDRRTQIVEDRVREANRLETCADPCILKHIQAQLEHLQQLERELDRLIAAVAKQDADFQKKASTMMQLVGVGAKTALTLLAHFPELGCLTRQQVASLAGMAPHPRESGTWRGKRRIYGGRAAVRRAMYMAAKTAARCCPVISAFYRRLRENGKSYNAALIACARKMLIRINTVLKEMHAPDPRPNEAQAT